MRIHSDKLTPADVYRATTARGMSRAVSADVTRHGSSIRTGALELKLTGTSSRLPNFGTARGVDRFASEYSERAATWDEWGMVIAELFAVDPAAVFGSPTRPTYNGAAQFHRITRNRFKTLTAANQHGRGGHRWAYEVSTGLHACKCGATYAPHAS